MGKAPTITAGPPSSNDSYTISEDQASGGAVRFNVRLNDGAKSTLYSLDDGQSADLVTQDGVLVPQSSRLGATIAITADGQVSYTNSSAAVQALAQGQTLHDSFLYAVRLQNGSLVWQTVTVTITGSNDVPVAVADVSAVGEDAVTTGSVAANDLDIDNGAVLSFATTDQIPAGFSMASNGSWAFDGSNAAYQSLGAGQTQQYVVQYWVTDQYGASSSSTLTLTVTGRNDAPAAATASGAVAEDQSITGQLTASDPDAGSSLTFELNEAAPAGFALTADGSWSFDASSYDTLEEGETQTLLVRYAAVDGAGARGNAILFITVTGRNDAPAIASATALADEDSLALGRLSATDVDGEPLTYSVVGETPAGFSMDADGIWTLDGAAYQSLGAGDFPDLVVNVAATDRAGASATSTLTITLRGANDAPVAGAATGQAVEDDYAWGALPAEDPDQDARLTYQLVGEVPDGLGLAMAPDGSWAWRYDGTVAGAQSLAQNEFYTLSATYLVTDEHGASATSTITLSVRGNNDAPVTTSQWFEAAEGMSASGTLQAFDPDNGAALTFAIAGEAPAGFALNADGGWTFDASDPAYDHIAEGGYVFRYVPFTVTDEHGASIAHTFVLSITGSNDGAIITGDTSGTVVEDSAEYMIGGNLDAVDPDDGDDVWQSQNVTDSVGGYGAFTVDGSGNWLYAVRNSHPTVDALNAGETRTDSFVVRTLDGTAQTVTVTIQGAGSFTYVPPAVSTDADPGEDSGYWNPDYVNYAAPRTVSGTINDDRIDGSNYNDTITGRDGYDLIYAHDGDDLIYGDVSSGSVPWGNDRIYGQGGNDTIIGGSGSDVLYGGSGSDTIYGNGAFASAGTDSDVLFGGSGNDYLYGSDNGDRFTGGLGADYLYGGGGRDWFQFQLASQTGDTIADFQQGQDSIVIVDLHLSPANFVGRLAERGRVEDGQVGYFIDQNGDTTVYIDTDGELGADLEIHLTGSYGITVNDFIWA